MSEELYNKVYRDYIKSMVGKNINPTAHDPVNKPKHYNSHPSGIECIEITRDMPFNLGNAIKYIWRCFLKGNTIEDLEKAIWYLQDQVKHERMKQQIKREDN